MSENRTANKAMLEIAVNAAGGGHDLEGFEVVSDADGYQAKCRNCGKTVWVGVDGLVYSLLRDSCGG